jgi:serine phosphatase RsbU (regulator of sigma subunit)
MFDRFDQQDRRAAFFGAFVLVVVGAVYPLVAADTARPLAAFVLPCLLTAVLGGWRPTLLIGVTSFVVAVIIGLAGPLDPEALWARWVVIAIGVVMGAAGAAQRQGQAGRLEDLHQEMSLRGAFQRALAPAPIPPPGYVAVARYRPAEQRLELGGDFLEAVALADGRFAVLIGDVCGHGPREAAFGAALRAGWKAIALSGKQDPADWVEALHDAFFEDGRIDTYATICTGYLDASAGVARVVNAGHPQPILLGPRARLLDVPSTPPLGLGFDEQWTATELRWSGQPILFYTDGLIENPNRQGPPRRWGEAGLLGWLDARPATGSLAGLADGLLESATAGRDVRDDIAILVVAADR